MEKAYDLRACPFCGEPGTLEDFPRPYRHGWVGCRQCRFYRNWQVNPKDAIAAWNTRKRPNKRTDVP